MFFTNSYRFSQFVNLNQHKKLFCRFQGFCRIESNLVRFWASIQYFVIKHVNVLEIILLNYIEWYVGVSLRILLCSIFKCRKSCTALVFWKESTKLHPEYMLDLLYQREKHVSLLSDRPKHANKDALILLKNTVINLAVT